MSTSEMLKNIRRYCQLSQTFTEDDISLGYPSEPRKCLAA